MIFNFSWTNKKDGDDIYAEHVNSLADGIKETQEAVDNISIDIDTEMSDTSTNAVQNKVVKTYIDESVGDVVEMKADKPTITTSTDTALSFEFSANTNTEIRTNEVTSLSFTFGNGEYVEDYTSGISFDSGETPTAIDYTDSGILNWVGTDCVTSDGLSIFQPSANTHYDIVFYFNGKQFIGLVNGYVPAGGNEAI